MKAFLLLIAIFLFSHQATAGIGQGDPANIPCFQSGGSCKVSCPFPSVDSGDCSLGLRCCKWPRQGPA